VILARRCRGSGCRASGRRFDPRKGALGPAEGFEGAFVGHDGVRIAWPERVRHG